MSESGLVVCDSGPLIALAGAGCLNVLEGLYGSVLIPDAVHHEVVVAGAGRMGATEVRRACWIECRELGSPPDPLLSATLGPGEAAAIALAREIGARLVLVDEIRPRKVARLAYGLHVKGTAGILVAAKHKGLIAAVRPLLEGMRARGYRLADELIDEACEKAGE